MCTNLQAQIVTRFSIESVQGHCSICRRGGGSSCYNSRVVGGLPLKWDFDTDKADREHAFRITNRPSQPFVVHLGYQQNPISFLYRILQEMLIRSNLTD